MKIRSLLPKIVLCLAALTATHQARATLIASYTDIYMSFVYPEAPFSFTYGVSENFPAGMGGWDAALLTVDPFTNSVWGSTYTLNASNTASFSAFTAVLTDGEEDWLGNSIYTSTSYGHAYGPESWRIFGAASGPFGADLIGYDISEITILFEEDHFFDFMNPQVQGKYTVSFSGSLASIPDASSTLGLVIVALGLLHLSHRRWRRA